MSELEQLAALCVRLGAEEKAAPTLAAQLLKRADQLAATRGVTREAALTGLVKLMIDARTGAAGRAQDGESG